MLRSRANELLMYQREEQGEESEAFMEVFNHDVSYVDGNVRHCLHLSHVHVRMLFGSGGTVSGFYTVEEEVSSYIHVSVEFVFHVYCLDRSSQQDCTV